LPFTFSVTHAVFTAVLFFPAQFIFIFVFQLEYSVLQQLHLLIPFLFVLQYLLVWPRSQELLDCHFFTSPKLLLFVELVMERPSLVLPMAQLKVLEPTPIVSH